MRHPHHEQERNAPVRNDVQPVAGLEVADEAKVDLALRNAFNDRQALRFLEMDPDLRMEGHEPCQLGKHDDHSGLVGDQSDVRPSSEPSVLSARGISASALMTSMRLAG